MVRVARLGSCATTTGAVTKADHPDTPEVVWSELARSARNAGWVVIVSDALVVIEAQEQGCDPRQQRQLPAQRLAFRRDGLKQHVERVQAIVGWGRGQHVEHGP